MHRFPVCPKSLEKWRVTGSVPVDCRQKDSSLSECERTEKKINFQCFVPAAAGDQCQNYSSEDVNIY